MITKIKNAVVVEGENLLQGHSVYFSKGRIIAVTTEQRPYDRSIDANGLYLAPGFIDIHTHGGGGYDFADGTVEDILNAASAHAAHGTTTIYPTAPTLSAEDTLKFIRNVKEAMAQNGKGKPYIAGTHLEGPYFAMSQRGAQDPRFIHPPKPEEYNEWIREGEGTLKRISFAPELEGAEALCDTLREQGIIAAYGHTDAIYPEIKPLIDRGCRLATHLYSGMNTVTRRNLFRQLGGVETAFLEKDVTAEIIADGLHLPPELLRMIYQIKGADRLCLVTDSMRGAGMGEGPSVLGPKENGTDCIIKDGIAYLTDMTSFCGSVATADRLVRVMHQEVGIPLPQCIKMITETPAAVMGLKDRGKLQEGYIADLVLFDENINIQKVYIEGKEF